MPEFVMTRKFGLELQFDKERVEKDYLMNILRGSDPLYLDSDEPVGRTNNRWVLKNGGRVWEVNSPAFEPNVGSVIQARSVLRDLKFQKLEEGNPIPQSFEAVTKKCSYHLHLDISDLNSSEMLEILQTAWRIEGAIRATLPPSRLCEDRVKSLKTYFTSCPAEVSCLGSLDETFGVHFSNYLTRGSMEITYASGTSSGNKIMNWFIFWHCLVQRVLQVGPIAEETNDISAVCDWLRLDTDTGEEQTSLGMVRDFLVNRSDRMKDRRTRRVLAEL